MTDNIKIDGKILSRYKKTPSNQKPNLLMKL